VTVAEVQAAASAAAHVRSPKYNGVFMLLPPVD
jgi:hypothetical protein